MYQMLYSSPIGPLCLSANENALTNLHFGALPLNGDADSPLLDQAIHELDEYFSGKRFTFTVPMNPKGTPFQRSVWEALEKIPYGETRTYQDIARAIGNPKASRAVGMANHQNPLAIFIPCHRVVGANGKLTGYAGGLGIKQFLLDLERKFV